MLKSIFVFGILIAMLISLSQGFPQNDRGNPRYPDNKRPNGYQYNGNRGPPSDDGYYGRGSQYGDDGNYGNRGNRYGPPPADYYRQDSRDDGSLLKDIEDVIKTSFGYITSGIHHALSGKFLN